MTILKDFISRQFLLFLIVGGVAAGLHWGSRFIFNIFVDYVTALFLAYAVGIMAGYILNAMFVFSSRKEKRAKEISYFVIFNLLMLPFVILISWGVAELLEEYFESWRYPRALAHAIGVSTPVFTNFLFHKYFTFNER